MTALPLAADRALDRRRVIHAGVAVAVVAAALGLAILGTARPVLAVLVLSGVVAIWCLGRPDGATYIVAAILYSNAAAIAVNEHGLPYLFGLAFPLLLAVPLAYHLLLRHRPVTITSGFPLLFGYLIVQVLGTVVARDTDKALEQTISFAIGGFGLYLAITNVVRSFEVLRKVVWVVLAVGATLGALTGYQMLTGSYGNEYFGFARVNFAGNNEVFTGTVTTIPRLEGPVGEVNRFAQILLVLLPVGALLAWGERRLLLKALALALTLLCLVGMATTASRGAAIALVITIVAAALFRYFKPVHLVAAVAVMAVLLAAFPRYGERLVNLQAVTALDRAQSGTGAGDTSNLRGRATETLAALLVFVDHPLIGVGPGNFPAYYHEYARAVSEYAIDTRIDLGEREAHNLYTHVAAESGGIGFLLFMGILLITMRDLRRARIRLLRSRPDVAHLCTGFYLAILAYLASGIGLHLSYERYFWFLAAMGGITAYLALRLPAGAPHGPGNGDPARTETAAGNGALAVAPGA